MGADAFDEVVGGGHVVVGGEGDGRDEDVGEAIGGVATLAEEMDVHVVVGGVVVAEAELVGGGVVTVLDGMDEVVFTEEGECTEDAGLVECDESVLKFGEGERTVGFAQCIHHEDAIGSWADAVGLEGTLNFEI